MTPGDAILKIIPTPKTHQHPFRAADFATLTDALDYAAQGETGANFYTRRGQLYASLPYRELQIARSRWRVKCWVWDCSAAIALR